MSENTVIGNMICVNGYIDPMMDINVVHHVSVVTKTK